MNKTNKTIKTKEKLERITIFYPAYDKRNPDPIKNYGIGSVKVLMVLKGKSGAVSFSFGTGMYLPKTHREWLNKPEFASHDPVRYMGYEVGYHSPKPQFIGQERRKETCQFIGVPCYCGSSALRADEFMDILIVKGSEDVWKLLEKDYEHLFVKKSAKL